MVAYLYSRPGALRNCFRGILLGLSDQSLVTGLSIKSAALGFGSNDISVYHFELAMDLASLTLGVHLLSNLVLSVDYIRPFRGEAGSSRGQRHKQHRGWVVKLVFIIILKRLYMLATTILLIFMWSTTNFDSSPNCPTRCLWSDGLPSSQWQKMRKCTVYIIVADTLLFVILGDAPNGDVVPEAWWSWRQQRLIKVSCP